jgi:hypothetical protein
MASSCKKEDKKFCYKCTVSGGNQSTFEMCDLTEDDAKEMEAEFNVDSEGDGTWTCAKK